MEKRILSEIVEHGSLNSWDYAKKEGLDHQAVVGQLKSLEMAKILALTQQSVESWILTSEGTDATTKGTLEYQIYKSVGADGVPKVDLEKTFGSEFQFGFQYCMKRKWLSFDKTSGKVQLQTKDGVEDTDGLMLQNVKEGKEVSATDLAYLQKRKLIEKKVVNLFVAKPGSDFSTEKKEEFADISADMLKRKDFDTLHFKPFNLQSLGKEISSGSLHPLMKVKSTFREIFLELGFEEMPTNQFVENSFWNFDSLFVPQQHPARDSQDTFFVKDPAQSSVHDEKYWNAVKEIHEKGGHGSIGWRYNFSIDESRRNIFRTHTTAISSRMLNKLAAEGFKDCKLFSIDRVFRNETLDATHLAEFHQIEGLVCGRNLGIQHLMGIIKEFLRKIGITEIRFKPAYNPYTEPSMEIFCYHPQLKKLIEIGNSGIFRPEMLKPMGAPDDFTVIAWGLGLERPTMINYGISNIRTLFGPDIDIKDMRTNPISSYE